MLKNLKNIIYLIFFFTFIFLILSYYFSDVNTKFTNKSRTSYLLESNLEKLKIPLLKNDTNNIIIYKNDLDDFNNNRKKYLWEQLISN